MCGLHYPRLDRAYHLVFGLVTSLKATCPGLWSTLKDAVGSIAGSGGQVVLRRGLVSVQMALSFLLLFGAGLFVRSLQNLKDANTGFREIDAIAKFRVAPALNGYQTDRVMRFIEICWQISAVCRASRRRVTLRMGFFREVHRIASCPSKVIEPQMAKTCRLI